MTAMTAVVSCRFLLSPFSREMRIVVDQACVRNREETNGGKRERERERERAVESEAQQEKSFRSPRAAG